MMVMRSSPVRPSRLMGLVNQLAVRWPAAVLCLVVLISIATGYGATRLQFNDGMQTAFEGSAQAYQDFVVHSERFTAAETDIVVVFTASDAMAISELEAIRDFALDATLAVNVDSVISIFSLRTPPTANEPTRALFPNDLTETIDLTALLARAREHPLGGQRLLSEDFRHSLVIVSLVPERSEIGPARETLAELEYLLTDVRQAEALSAEVTGLIPIRQKVIDGQLNDLLVLNAIGMALGSLFCLLALRSVLLATLTGLPAAVALLWVLGTMGLLGFEINLLTNVVPVLILVLSLADSLHLTLDLRRQLGTGASVEDAVSCAMRRVAPACALTSFTTAIAFAALYISDSQLVRSLGLAGGMATLISLCSVLLVHPLAFLLVTKVSRLNQAIRSSRPSSAALFSGSPFFSFAFQHPGLVSFGSIAALVCALGAFSLAKPEYTFLENVSDTDRAIVALQAVNTHLSPTATIDIPVTLPEGGLRDPSALSRIQRVEALVEASLPGASVSSFADLVRWINASDDRSGIDTAVSVLADLSPTQQRRLVSEDQSAALVRVFVPDRGAQETLALLKKLEAAFREDGLATGIVEAPTGLLAMSSQISLRMIRHLNVSFTMAVCAAGLFIALWYRNLRYGLLALVPNVFPIACVGAWLTIGGNGLQFSSAIALTVAFGIAVDDTIHVLNRVKLTAPADAPFDPAAIKKAFTEISPALVTTTLVLSFGMLGTQFASIPTIAYFGLITIVVFALALLSVLIVLPALMIMSARIGKTAPKGITE